jgi:tetratricopeptide (TPR) repeat protein
MPIFKMPSTLTKLCFFRFPNNKQPATLSWAFLIPLFFLPQPLCFSQTADPAKAQELIDKGEYEQAIEMAQLQVDKKTWNENWPRILASALLIQGKTEQAMKVYEDSLERFGDSMRLKLLGHQIYLENNLPQKAQQQLDDLTAFVQRSPWKYSAKSELVPLGEFFLLKDEDPKQVLKLCFDQAVKANPKNIDAYRAIATMAIDKSDYQVAADAITKALKLSDTNPDLHQLAFQTWYQSDRTKAAGHLQKALEINPKHVPSLLLKAQTLIDRESYEQAQSVLEQVESINPSSSILWALRAAIAHLKNDFKNEAQYRSKAIEKRQLNPAVDYTIGKNLSMHYRFAEGAKYQQRALTADPNFHPAQTQLAQDLLRLGNEAQGWDMVQQARRSDPFHVTNYNLQILKTELDKYTSIEFPGFVLRMDKQEAELFADRVVETLTHARNTLVEKYKAKLQEPIVVDLFAKQRDFAIRTFGLPGGEGFLGVCFGRVITANSPTALNVEHNWQSVLWHEYCHVITLQLTDNKMPRWLSEGISVYEENQKKTAWGEPPQPTYIHWIRSGDFSPPSQLSSMFLAPSSPERLQFAYFIASWVVQFFVEQFGHDGLLQLLEDLRNGLEISQALARRTGSIDGFDQAFRNYAIERANQIAPNLNLHPSDPSNPKPNNLASYAILHNELTQSINEKNWDQARIKAKTLVDLWPTDPSNANALRKWIAIENATGNTNAERQALTKLVEIDPHDTIPLKRLVEIDLASQDFLSVEQWCQAILAIRPDHAPTLDSLATASEKLNQPASTINALLALSLLEPIDPANLNLRLAQAYRQLAQNSTQTEESLRKAKRYCLKALEESPRYEQALQLLQELASAPR